jgi:hypothetical protein
MYGPNPYITRLKCPSGHLVISGIIIPGRKVHRIADNEEWNSCRRKVRNGADSSNSRSPNYILLRSPGDLRKDNLTFRNG